METPRGCGREIFLPSPGYLVMLDVGLYVSGRAVS